MRRDNGRADEPYNKRNENRRPDGRRGNEDNERSARIDNLFSGRDERVRYTQRDIYRLNDLYERGSI